VSENSTTQLATKDIVASYKAIDKEEEKDGSWVDGLSPFKKALMGAKGSTIIEIVTDDGTRAPLQYNNMPFLKEVGEVSEIYIKGRNYTTEKISAIYDLLEETRYSVHGPFPGISKFDFSYYGETDVLPALLQLLAFASRNGHGMVKILSTLMGLEDLQLFDLFYITSTAYPHKVKVGYTGHNETKYANLYCRIKNMETNTGKNQVRLLFASFMGRSVEDYIKTCGLMRFDFDDSEVCTFNKRNGTVLTQHTFPIYDLGRTKGEKRDKELIKYTWSKLEDKAKLECEFNREVGERENDAS